MRQPGGYLRLYMQCRLRSPSKREERVLTPTNVRMLVRVGLRERIAPTKRELIPAVATKDIPRRQQAGHVLILMNVPAIHLVIRGPA